MTERDYVSQPSGYFPSAWPAECGGPRRQKVTRAKGLALSAGERLKATTRMLGDDLWPVMFVHRNHEELYLQGGTRIGQRRASFGWVKQLDPITLETIRETPKLPSGGHNWCGAVCVHENGDLYMVNGRYCHRLSPDLSVVAEHRIETDNAHNGHVVLSDGNLVTKDIQNDPRKRSFFTVLNPDLKVVDRFEFPANSVGRFSCDRLAGRDHLYVTSSTDIYRLVYASEKLSMDQSWHASYAVQGEDQSFAWDSTIGSDSVWFMDMGETSGVRRVLAAHPVGTNSSSAQRIFFRIARTLAPFGSVGALARGGIYGRPLHGAPVRVFRVNMNDASDMEILVPFGLQGGGIVAPPLYDQDRKILVAHDLMNRKVGAWRHDGDDGFKKLWIHDYLNTNQMTLYADTGELLVDDCKTMGRWDAVVVDVETGEEKGRVDTGCVASGGMWYTPGFGRDFYTSTGLGGIARIYVE